MFEITRSTCTLFGLTIHWYGVLIASAVLLAVLTCLARERRLGLKKDTSVDLALVCVPSGVIAARLYYVIFNWSVYAARPIEALYLWQGGLAVYGGVIGGAIGAWLYARAKRISFRSIADLVAPALALAQCVGRWGNFLNQEAYGVEIVNPALRFFPIAVRIGGSWHCATFFYESAWCALIAALLLIGEKKRFFHRRGDSFLAYLTLYAAERAIVEGLRTDSLYLGALRVSQLVSLAALLALLILLAMRSKGAPIVLRLAPMIALAASAACVAGEKLLPAAGLMLITLALALLLTIQKRRNP